MTDYPTPKWSVFSVTSRLYLSQISDIVLETVQRVKLAEYEIIYDL